MALPTLPIDAPAIIDIYWRLNYPERERFAASFAERINACATENGVDYAAMLAGGGEREGATIADNGYARLGVAFESGKLRDIHDHFASRPVFNGHVAAKSDGVPHTVDELAGRSPFACYRQDDVVTAPYLLEFANDPRILAIAARSLGCVPTLYSMNAWWSYPTAGGAAPYTQTFHRDSDDFRNCVLFVFLTDVGDNDGAHEYIRGTQSVEAITRHMGGPGPYFVDLAHEGTRRRYRVELKDLFDTTGYCGDHIYAELFPSLIETIGGPAGSAFMTETRGLHRARIPRLRRRLILWIRYGMYRNNAYIGDRLSPAKGPGLMRRIGDTPAARFINRLIVDDD